MRLATDENFNRHLLAALLRADPGLDIVRVQDIGLGGSPDPDILDWAASVGRILLTHDVTTMTDFAYKRLDAGLPMPGIFAVSSTAPLGPVLTDLLLLIGASFEGEWEGQIRYVPLRS